MIPRLTLSGLLLSPTVASASDFSIFRYILNGATILFALVFGAVAYLISRKQNSIALRSISWGLVTALFLMPVHTIGGNGTSYGPPFRDFLSLLLGSDPLYAQASLRALVYAVPLCSALVAFLIWLSRKR
jgi:hypothetical protein